MPHYNFTFRDWVFIALLCLMSVVLVRSMFFDDRIDISNPSASIFQKFGVLAVCIVDDVPRNSNVKFIQYFARYENPFEGIDWLHLTTTWTSGFFDNPIDHDVKLLGFRYTAVHSRAGKRGFWVQIPDWFILLALAVPIIRKLRLRRQLRSLRLGNFCLECGYDLTGSPDRCPECGRADPNKQVP